MSHTLQPWRPRKATFSFRDLALLAWFLCGFCIGGCVAVVPYQPNDRLVDTLGRAQTQQRLQEVLLRSLNPRIIDLDIDEETIRYRAPTSGHVMGYQSGVSSSVETRLDFLHIARCDVHASHVVFVRGADDRPLAHLAFATEQDAKTFADLLLSLRADRLRHTSGKR
jgi:hypothetical protein